MEKNLKSKTLFYTLLFLPILIFIAEITSLFFLKENYVDTSNTKYDAITGWRKDCKNNNSNVLNDNFLICNRHGLIKTPYQSEAKNTFGILLLGNSVAMGEGLYGYGNKKTFASQLEINLRSHDRSIDLINGAYSGFNTWQEHAELARYLNVEPFYDDLPSLDMVVSFGGIQDFWGFLRLLNNFEKSSGLEYGFANNMMIEKTTIDYINFLSSSSLGNIKSGLTSFINSIKARSKLLKVFEGIHKNFQKTKYNKKIELVINQDKNSASENLKEIIENSFGITFEQYTKIRDYHIGSIIRNLRASSNLLNPEIEYVYVYAPTYFSSLSKEDLNKDNYVIGIKHLVGYPKFSLKIFDSEMRIIEQDYRSRLLSQIEKIPSIFLLDFSREAKSFWFFDYSHFTEYAASKITLKLSKELLLIRNQE